MYLQDYWRVLLSAVFCSTLHYCSSHCVSCILGLICQQKCVLAAALGEPGQLLLHNF